MTTVIISAIVSFIVSCSLIAWHVHYTSKWMEKFIEEQTKLQKDFLLKNYLPNQDK